MNINLDVPILDLEDNEIEFNGEKMLLKTAIIRALITEFEADAKSRAEEKITRIDLALKCKNGGDVEITPEEAVLIKSRINTAFGALVTHRAHKLIG